MGTKALIGAVILLVAGATFGGAGWYMYQTEQSDLENAVEVRGTVESTSIDRDVRRRDRDDDGIREEETTFTPVVSYTYTYQGTNHTSDSVYAGPEKSFDSRSEAADVVDEYEAGDRVDVSVNSEDPSRAFLIQKEDSLFYYLFMGAGVVLGLAGLGSLVRAITGGD